MLRRTVEMENLGKVGPTLPVYFRWQLLKHRKHKSPPTLCLRACCHFRHIRRKIGSVILKIGEQQLPMFKDGVVANTAIGNCAQNAGPNGPMVLKVFVSALWFQADHLTITLHIGEFSLSGRELVCNGQRQPYLWWICGAASIGRICRWGYSFCAMGVPGGLTPMLDCGG